MGVFKHIPVWYLMVTIVISAYHCYRGYRYYWLHVATRESFSNWSTRDRVVLLCVQAAYLYLICSLLGFFALLTSHSLLVSQQSLNSIDTGLSVLITFSFIIGILGVSGELGQLIQQGKISTSK